MSGDSSLLEILREANDLYQAEVVHQGKLYQRFAEDFVLSHEFHDALDAKSRNEHQKNYNILKSLLMNRRDLVEQFFYKEECSDDDIHQMIRLFNTTVFSNRRTNAVKEGHTEASVSFCSCLELDDCDVLARSCNDVGLFRDSVTASELYSLFDGGLEFPLRSRNNRLVAFFFDQLSIFSLIIRNWQNVIAKQKCILSSKEDAPLTQKALSSALYALNGVGLSSEERIIESSIKKVSDKYPANRKSGL